MVHIPIKKFLSDFWIKLIYLKGKLLQLYPCTWTVPFFYQNLEMRLNGFFFLLFGAFFTFFFFFGKSINLVTFFLSCSTTSFSLSNKEWLFCGFFSPFTDHKSQLKHNGAFFRQNLYFVTKLFWPTVRKKCSSDWEKLI